MTTADQLRQKVADRRQGATPGTDVDKAEPPREPVTATFIARLVPEIKRTTPPGLDAVRIARLALTVVRQTPDLALCTQRSFAGAVMTAAALGLDIGLNGEAYLVPFKNNDTGEMECTLIVGYQGLGRLFLQHPLARHWDAQAVHEEDHFEYARGTRPYLTHIPAKGNRGKIVAYYAVFTLTNGGSDFEVLSPDEVKKIRGGRVGPKGKIADPMHHMERKTAWKQLAKRAPKSTRFAVALAADEQPGNAAFAEQITPQALPAGTEPAAESDSFIPGLPLPEEVAEEVAAVLQPEPPADSEPVEGEWAPEPEPISTADIGRLHGMFGKLKLGGDEHRDLRLRATSRLAGRDVSSSTQLLGYEADRVIKALELVLRYDDPPTAFAQLLKTGEAP